MKSPFAILLAVVVVAGIGIGVLAIVFFGATEQGSDEDAIPIASERDLPTPSVRTVSERQAPADEETQSEVVVVSTSVSTETFVADEAADIEGIAEEDGGEFVVEVEAAEQAAPGGQRGFGAFGGGGQGGGAGGPNFQAIQEAIESNPEIQELMQKVQSGSMSQEDQARLRDLMQEALAEAGIEAPGRGQGGGFGAPPIQGTISAINGSTITIEHADDTGLSTEVQIGGSTNITVISELEPSDLSEGANVAGSVQRGEGGRIFIVNLTVLPEQQDQAQGGFRGLFGGGFAPGSGDASNLSNISGTVSNIDGQTVSVETTQGTLRLTANEDSNIISTSQGTLNDIAEGMATIAFGGNPDETPIQPTNLIVGPETLLQGDAVPRGTGGGRQGN